MRALPPLLVLLAGCYSERRFVEDYDLAYCEKVFECSDDAAIAFMPFEDVEDCQGFRADQTDEEHPLGEDCAYDASEASDCVEALSAMSCAAYDDGDDLPSCERVCGAE